MLGTALKQQGELDAAAKALREAIRLDPTTPGPYNLLGQILRQQGDLPASKAMFAEGARVKKLREAQQKTMFDRSAMESVGPRPRPR